VTQLEFALHCAVFIVACLCIFAHTKTKIMLVYGTCNPEGYGDSNYEGLYLTDADIKQITPQMQGIPVKIEHRGVDVGQVVTAWMHEVCCLLIHTRFMRGNW
jgi:hypothetical protein